jgi:MFS family permease
MTEFAGAFGKPVTGLISDRLLGGQRKAAFLVLATISGIICLVLATGWCSPGWALYPILFVLGITAIGWSGLYMALVSELGGKEAAATGVGLATSVVILGVVTGPPLFGYVVDRTGSYQQAWLVMALAGFTSAVFVFLVREHKRRM